MNRARRSGPEPPGYYPLMPMRLFRSPTRPGRVTAPFRTRLTAERLEYRDGPAGLSAGLSPVGGEPTWAPDTQSGFLQPPANAAPQIVDFKAVEIGQGLFKFTGRVIDEAPSGLTVTFGGSVPTMNGRTTTTGTDGKFTLNVQLRRDGSDAGTVTAQTRDTQGLLSNTPSVDVSPSPP